MPRLLSLLLVLGSLVLAAPAAAFGNDGHHHVRLDPPATVECATVGPSPASPLNPWPGPGPTGLAVLGAALALLACRRSRRVVALSVVALLALFVFETGRHSVHHFGRPPDAQRCSLEAAAAHISGVTNPVVSVTPALVQPGHGIIQPLPESVVRIWARRPDAPRSPPTLLPA